MIELNVAVDMWRVCMFYGSCNMFLSSLVCRSHAHCTAARIEDGVEHSCTRTGQGRAAFSSCVSISISISIPIFIPSSSWSHAYPSLAVSRSRCLYPSRVRLNTGWQRSEPSLDVRIEIATKLHNSQHDVVLCPTMCAVQHFAQHQYQYMYLYVCTRTHASQYWCMCVPIYI